MESRFNNLTARGNVPRRGFQTMRLTSTFPDSGTCSADALVKIGVFAAVTRAARAPQALLIHALLNKVIMHGLHENQAF